MIFLAVLRLLKYLQERSLQSWLQANGFVFTFHQFIYLCRGGQPAPVRSDDVAFDDTTIS
jgi:hypothetical protein